MKALPSFLLKNLLGFRMQGVLLAERAILAELELVGRVLLVLEGIVVSLLALIASERDLDSHFSAPPCNIWLKASLPP
jgi:hypothetical protein